MSDLSSIYWRAGTARIDAFTTSANAARGTTTITVKLAVTDPWELGDIVRQLADLRSLPPVQKAKPHD